MSAIGKWVSSFGVALVAGLIAASQTGGIVQTGSLLGTGRGLDHVIIIVRDLEQASRVYSEALGFSVIRGGTFPGGLRNSAVLFGSTYLELMSVDPSQARPDDELVTLLKQREGGYAFALNVSSARETADFLRTRKFDVTGPAGSSFLPEGSKEVQTSLWQTVSITRPSLPFEPIFFIQYASRGPRSKQPEHRNTAERVHAVWIAVKDLETATQAYEALGLRLGSKLHIPQLAARGREISAGQGAILLLQAKSTKGPLSSVITGQGEGVIGVSIEVRDLEVARSLMRDSNKQELRPYRGLHGRSILVAPEFTRGVWIEFFQKTGA